MMTTTRAAVSLIGEVHCLNCGRILAEVVDSGEGGRHLLRRAARHAVIEVTLVGPHSLQCAHCGGRAMVEPFDEPQEELAHKPAPTWAGAA